VPQRIDSCLRCGTARGLDIGQIPAIRLAERQQRIGTDTDQAECRASRFPQQ
jgi:hypothetical protein